MRRLVIRSGPLENREFPLQPGTIHIGRAFANDIQIDEPSVSSSHCHIVVGDEAATIIDLNSTNGTFVNGAPVQSARLQSGDVVQLGGVECEFVVDAPMARPTVRVVAHKPADAPPPPPALPPAPPRIAPPLPPVSAVPVEPGVCKSHPKSPARHYCPQCQRYFCDLCVATRHGEGGASYFCRGCGAECAPVAAMVAPRPSAPSGFFARLPGAFVYPFRGSGTFILIGATILFAALNWLAHGLFGLFIQVTANGYLFSFLQNILHATAAEEGQLPELPGMADFWEDIILPFFRLLGVVLVAFGPALGLMWYAIANEQPAAGVAVIPAVIFGCLYFPMAFLAVAMLDSIAAVNPLLVVPSILKAPLAYLVTVVLLGVVLGMRWLGDAVVGVIFTGSLFTESTTEFVLMVVVRVLWAFVGLYLLTVAIRILGLLYVSKQEEFGWLNR